jgi:hypothetical protein
MPRRTKQSRFRARRIDSKHFRSNGRPKQPYDSEADAQDYLERTKREDTLEPYPCWCGKYHVGNIKVPQ